MLHCWSGAEGLRQTVEKVSLHVAEGQQPNGKFPGGRGCCFSESGLYGSVFIMVHPNIVPPCAFRVSLWCIAYYW